MEESNGKSALVTGGASGIGLACARRLAAAGSRVMIADIDATAGAAAAAEVGGMFHPLDVSDPGQWALVVAATVEAFGRLDIALLNAGIALGEPDPVKVDDAAYRRILGVNVDGVVFGVRAVIPVMNDGGAILVTASLGGLTPMPADPVYSMTKHAVVAYVRSVAPALAGRGILINALCPGPTETPMVTAEFQREVEKLGVPLLSPEAVADAAISVLGSDRSGKAWYVQLGRPAAPYEFRGVPGPVRPG